MLLLLIVTGVTSISFGQTKKVMDKNNKDSNFKVEEIRAAERKIIALLEDEDVNKRVAAYTVDAIFVMDGVPPVHGRDELLKRKKTRLFDVSLVPHSTEGNEKIACVYGVFTGFVGRTESSKGQKISMRFLILWRKESDGVWRIAKEFLTTDAVE